MELPENNLRQLLEKYHNGTASPEERRMLEQWYGQMNISSEPVWNSADQEADTREKLFREVSGRTVEIEMAAKVDIAVKHRINLIMHSGISRVAAMLLLFAGSICGVYFIVANTHPQPAKLTSQNYPGTAVEDSSLSDPPILSMRTGTSGKKKVQLPDGSTAWLNAGTVLNYPSSFTRGSRHVYVERGEVFFTIRADAAKPFIVHTGSVATTVLGTSFLVKQSYKTSSLEIIVKTGKVRVEKFNERGAHEPIGRDLLPGDQLRFDTTANTYQLKSVSVKGIAAFTEGRLYYDDARLEEIAYDIGNKYNIKISFADSSLKQCHYRIGFDDISLEDCLQILSVLTNTRIEKHHKNHYIINGTSCN